MLLLIFVCTLHSAAVYTNLNNAPCVLGGTTQHLSSSSTHPHDTFAPSSTSPSTYVDYFSNTQTEVTQPITNHKSENKAGVVETNNSETSPQTTNCLEIRSHECINNLETHTESHKTNAAISYESVGKGAKGTGNNDLSGDDREISESDGSPPKDMFYAKVLFTCIVFAIFAALRYPYPEI